MSLPTVLNVFNRYRESGGEEKWVNWVQEELADTTNIHPCFFESAAWFGDQAPSRLQQVSRMFYNKDSGQQFRAAIDSHRPQAALFHNIYPVGSPALYRTALQRRVPVIQYLHNYRPFSVGGSLYSRDRLLPDALYGSYLPEVREGTWQGSVLKSAVMASMLKMLHRSGWLESVKCWLAISEFMRDRLVQSGSLPASRVHTLRHAWRAMPQRPAQQDAGYYLFLGRLSPVKGIETMLDTWDKLYSQLGNRTPRLHLAGQGPLEPLIHQRARSNPYICHLGQVGGETKHDQLLRARAVLVPSTWWEPLGLVVYEAYDYAKPVLAARSGGLTETVLHGYTGLQHEPGKSEDLLRDVLSVEAMSETERLTLGTNGRSWLLREADPGRWLKQFHQILAQVSTPNN